MEHNYEPVKLKRIGTGSSFQSRYDLTRNRLSNNNIDSLQDAVEKLRKTISKAGSLNIIKELSLHETIRSAILHSLNIDTGIPPAMVEYLFGVCTTIEPTSGNTDIGFYDVIDALSLVEDRLRFENLKNLDDAETIEEKQQSFIQIQLMEKEISTGPFVHGRQRREYARRVLGKCDNYIVDILDISVTDSILSADLLGEVMGQHIQQTILQALQGLIQKGAQSDIISHSEVLSKQKPDKELFRLVLEYDRQRLDPINNSDGFSEEKDVLFGNLSSHVKKVGIEKEAVKQALNSSTVPYDTFLEEFGISIGEYKSDPADLSGSINKFDYPFDHNPLHEYPILVDREGKIYHGPSNSLYYSLSTRPYYELLDSEYKDEADELIGEGNEIWVLECLDRISDENVEIIHSAEYDYKDGESDFVLIYDDTLVVLECKTRGPKLETRKGPFGDFNEIQANLSDIISGPYEQATKLINAIREGEIDEIKTGYGTRQLSDDDFDSYIPGVILARSLNAVGTTLYPDAVEFNNELPFVTDLYSFQTICRHVQGSSGFLDYLERRVAVAEQGRVFSVDELDYVGAYLDSNLSFPEAPSECLIDIIDSGSHLDRTYESDIDGLPNEDIPRL
ncbi:MULTISPECIES: NERD domain-containing protein [Halomicrobium]|uniref:Uncharacterized protein n=2 Tax=Halomicrobium mukohataei TaxID=57705 RepID=C7NZ82_HALMD|nr:MULTISPECIES: NERD domain-containing protein [Halomicrobium]ACV46768.1 hypothetical protein Hmuk_0636 [Halomicrobium mukohataei DSM 12286]QCD65275.1 hypothetical protein E5139_06335 [Halomicrobium mukohataei]QFR20081.1 hypothetical protein GBQ70_06330 [Halomicrobium sp. ZPS1]